MGSNLWGFLLIDDLVKDQGELALILELDKEGNPIIVGYKAPENNKNKFLREEVISTYLIASVDSVKYTDQELHTLESHLNKVVGVVESVKYATLKLTKVAMEHEAEVQVTKVKWLQKATNNLAEYGACGRAMGWVADNMPEARGGGLTVRGDSQLVVRQVKKD